MNEPIKPTKFTKGVTKVKPIGSSKDKNVTKAKEVEKEVEKEALKEAKPASEKDIKKTDAPGTVKEQPETEQKGPAKRAWDNPLREVTIKPFVTKEGTIVEEHQAKRPHVDKPAEKPKVPGAEEEAKGPKGAGPEERPTLKPKTAMAGESSEKEPSADIAQQKQDLACTLGV